MNAIWMTSMILQWAMIVVLSLLVLSLMRQLGERTKPVAKEKNPDDIFHPFTELVEKTVTLVSGEKFNFGGPEGTSTLIVFFSPNCGACEELPKALLELAKHPPAPEFRILGVLKRTDRAAAEEFIKDNALTTLPMALDEDFPQDLNPGGAPFAAALAEGGKVAARGKPKTLAHLREMAQAAQNIAHMAPGHSRRSHEWGESAPYWVPEQLAANRH